MMAMLKFSQHFVDNKVSNYILLISENHTFSIKNIRDQKKEEGKM